MKSQNVKKMIWLMCICLPILSMTSSCTMSDNNPSSETHSNAEPTIQKPKMSIQTAVISGNIEVVKQHIIAKTDLNEKEVMSGSTPIITAATFGKNQIAKLLIDAGVDLSKKNNDGATALHTAAFFCRIEIVRMLIDANADKSIRNNFGATPKESVMGPFADIKPIYVMLQEQLSPIGLKIDLNEIEKTRPIIVQMLQ